MTTRSIAAGLVMLWAALAGPAATAGAGEVRVLSAGALKDAITEAAPAFERECGCKLAMEFGPAGALKKKIEAGQGFDVAVLPVGVVEDLARQGRLAPGATPVARSGVGLIVKAGAARPDVSSEEAVKRTLLGAKSFSYSSEGATSDALRRMLDKLGIADEMKPKLMAVNLANESVIKGESEMGLVVISALSPSSPVDVTALPPQLQSYVDFAASVTAAPGDPAAAQAFVRWLRSPAMHAAIRTKRGLEPAP